MKGVLPVAYRRLLLALAAEARASTGFCMVEMTWLFTRELADTFWSGAAAARTASATMRERSLYIVDPLGKQLGPSIG